ncbi:MAG TPA: hypothetical protein VE956_24380 [Nodularia sp. (in: cyanobacteria)]|nr:hypothetical protein [Nodularia sp. (in: cyanobacteria)]
MVNLSGRKIASPRYKPVIGAFPHGESAATALNELKDPIVFLPWRNTSEQIAGSDVTDRSETEAQEGGFLGGVGGLLVGLEALIIPRVEIFIAGDATSRGFSFINQHFLKSRTHTQRRV